MDPVVKHKWIEALKSGNYKKGAGTLRDLQDKYCCLGVLCDIYIKEHKTIKWFSYIGNTSYSIHDNRAFLPEEVASWAEFGKNGLGIQLSLVGINDNSDRDDFNDVIPFIKKL